MKRRFFKLTQKLLICVVLCGLIVPTVAIENTKPSKGSVTINYKNVETGQQILNENGLPISENIDANFNDETAVKAKDIEGYTVIGSETQYATVTKDKPNAILTFSYAPKSSQTYKKAIVSCKDDKGNLIVNPTISENVTADEVNTTPPEMENWTYAKTDTSTQDNGNTYVITHNYTYKGSDTLPTKAVIEIECRDADSNAIITTKTKDGKLGLNTLTFEEIEGYTLKEGQQKEYYASYKTPKIKVIALYNKVEASQGTVTINKQLEDGTPIGTEVVQIPFNTPTEITAPKTQGYKATGLTARTVTLTPDNPTISITFTYIEVESGTITVRYLDKATNAKLAEPDVVKVDKYGKHTVKAKDIKGYTVSGQASKTVEVTKENAHVQVDFLYDKIPDPTSGSVVINYINQDNAEIFESEKLDNVPFGTRTYKAKQFKGYELVGEGTKSVTLSVEHPTATVSFLYKPIPTGGGSLTPDENNPKPEQPVKGKVTIKYIDTEGNLLCDTEVYDNLEEGEYTYKAKSFDGYTLQSNSTISFSINKDNTSRDIEFVYRKNVVNGKINILYVDNSTGESIKPSQVFNDLSNGIYSYTAENISGYNLVGPNKLSVEISANNPVGTLIFKYERLIASTDGVQDNGNGSILIRYIDSTTGEEVRQSISHTNLSLKEYTYSAETIEGYELVGDIDRTIELTADNPSQEIKFEYKKTGKAGETININVSKPDETSKNKDKNESLNEKFELPLIAKIALGVGAIALVILIVTIIVSTISSKRKQNESSDVGEDDDFLDDDI